MRALSLALLGLLIGTAPGVALETPEFSGSVRSLSQLVESGPQMKERMFLSSTTLRLAAEQALTKAITVEAALENQWLYANPTGIVTPDSDPPNTSADLTKTWREDENWSTRLHVDRLYLHGRHGALRWSAGRQPYGFGNIVILSPLDIIAPFSPDAIDTEYRPGVDALRFDYATSRGDLLSYVTVRDEDPSLSSYLATGSFNVAGLDLLLVAGDLRKREMGGLGLAGNLGGLGIKGELSWYQGKDVNISGGDLYDEFAIAATELWYRFDNDLIILVEYLYNGAGAEQPEAYLQAAGSATVTEGLNTLLGQNYLLFAPSIELHPLLSVSLLGIWNIDDDSYMVRPQIAISLGDNLSLNISHTLNRGSEPKTGLLPGLQTPRSEFGTYGDSAALYVRWYF